VNSHQLAGDIWPVNKLQLTTGVQEFMKPILVDLTGQSQLMLWLKFGETVPYLMMQEL